MMKLFPSQKDAAKQKIQLPPKIHQFKASYFLGIAGAWLSRCAGATHWHSGCSTKGWQRSLLPASPSLFAR